MAADVPPSEPAPRILVIRRRSVGDVIMLARLLRDLKAHWPAARLTLLVDRSAVVAAQLHATLDGILVFPRRSPQWPALWRSIRRPAFTHVIDLDNDDGSAIVTFLTRAPHRATMVRLPRRIRFRRIYHTTTALPATSAAPAHLDDDYHAAVAVWGVPASSRDHSVRLFPADVSRAQSLVAGPRPRVGVYPGGRDRRAIWPAELFAGVCDRLQDDLNAKVFLLGGTAEAVVIGQIRAAAESHLIALDPRLSLGELGAVFAQLDVLLCYDSDAMHLAAAVGTPVVALFVSESIAAHRPLGAHHTVLFAPEQKPNACIKADADQSSCVRPLDETSVIEAVVAQLTRTSAR